MPYFGWAKLLRLINGKVFVIEIVAGLSMLLIVWSISILLSGDCYSSIINVKWWQCFVPASVIYDLPFNFFGEDSIIKGMQRNKESH